MGRISSINVQKVVWGLDELGLAYDRIDAGGAFGVVVDASFRAMNPNGLVPTIAVFDRVRTRPGAAQVMALPLS